MKKVYDRQLTLKKFTLWPKKNLYKEFHTKKHSCRLRISHHSHNFSNGWSLTQKFEILVTTLISTPQLSMTFWQVNNRY